MTEKELIEGIKIKDQHVFKYFVGTFQAKVTRTCYGFLHNMHDAEDIAQEVFIEVFESIRKFKGQSTLSTWVYRIAVNKSLNYIRDNRKRTFEKPLESISNMELIGTPILQYEDPPPFGDEDLEQKKQAVYKAIDQLPNNQKAVFILNKYEDLSYKEVADSLGLSMASVESLIHRAKKNLQNTLLGKKKNETKRKFSLKLVSKH
jgi:RNA polymerase sigma-70 factor, ECF subfamily